MTQQTAEQSMVEAGMDYLTQTFDIRIEGNGVVVYREYPGTGAWYRVDADDLAHLGVLIERGDPDVYSTWCAESDAEEIADPTSR